MEDGTGMMKFLREVCEHENKISRMLFYNCAFYALARITANARARKAMAGIVRKARKAMAGIVRKAMAGIVRKTRKAMAGIVREAMAGIVRKASKSR